MSTAILRHGVHVGDTPAHVPVEPRALSSGMDRRGQRVRGSARLHEPEHRGPAGIELQGHVAAPHQDPGAGPPRSGVRDAGAGEDDLGRHDGGVTGWWPQALMRS